MTEKEKMLSGQPYNPADPALLSELLANQDAVHAYNLLRPSQLAERTALIKTILGSTGESVIVNAPFHCDYGANIHVGERFFANFNLTILDGGRVTFGDDCFIGPNVSIYTACHPLEAEARNTLTEWTEAVTIGDSVWIGGSVTIAPGVTIGDRVVIGAGSVVVKDIPSDSVAVGNPCRVIKTLPRPTSPDAKP